MKLSKEVLEYASLEGWYTVLRVIGEDEEGCPITDEDDVECFYKEEGVADCWLGHIIPTGYLTKSPEEMVEMYNYYILCEDAPTPGNL